MKSIFKNKSIKFKILTIPLIIILIIVASISTITILVAKSNLIDQMEKDGTNLVEQTVHQLQDNSAAVVVINEAIEQRISTLGNFLTDKSFEEIDNKILEEIAKYFDVDEINITDSEGKIIYSNLSSSIGSVFGKDHIAYSVLSGEKSALMENIRKSRETDDYYKYGYISRGNGGFIQIGILANDINELMTEFNVQNQVENLGEDPNIIYACFIDKNLKVSAHSNIDRIGIEVNDKGSIAAAVNGEKFTDKYIYPVGNIPTCDVLVPVYKNGEHIGAMNIGLSMESVYKTIDEIIIKTIIVAIISFVLALTVLYFISRSIIKPLSTLVDVSKKISKGEFNNDINIESKDEVGVLAYSFKEMSDSLKITIGTIKEQAINTSEMSSVLGVSSKEMTSVAGEMTAAIQNVTAGASEQANDLVQVTNHMEDLALEVNNINTKLSLVKNGSDETKNKAKNGRDQIDMLLKSIEEVRIGFDTSTEKLNNLDSSVSQIGNITDVINSISEQTNLLALNAAIEAARAGESGKGFAVVADEIRKLAEQSKSSTEEIQKLIQSISMETSDVIDTSNEVGNLVGDQVNSVTNTTEAFEEILRAVSDIIPLIADTYVSLNKTIEAKDIVASKIESVTSIAEEISASTEEIAASSEEMLSTAENVSNSAEKLNDVAFELNNETEKFKIE